MRTRERARPLPADERRHLIMAAAIPLVRSEGRSVTTRAIAEAAGVSEGTVFHVFEDKDALIDAVVDHEFRTDRTLVSLDAVDLELPLPERLVAIVELLRRRLIDVFELMRVLQLRRPPEPLEDGPARHQQLLDRVAELLEPDAHQLRHPTHQTAELVRIITFAASHPGITDHAPLTAEQIADLLLHGISADSSLADPRGVTAC